MAKTVKKRRKMDTARIEAILSALPADEVQRIKRVQVRIATDATDAKEANRTPDLM